MRYVVTITDKGYEKYTEEFLRSVRGAGWREGVKVFAKKDSGLYFNEEVILLEEQIHNPKFKDSRWLKCQLSDYFYDDDEILFCDSDMIVKPGFEKVFDDIGRWDITLPYWNFDTVDDNDILNDVYDMGVEGQRFADCNILWRQSYNSRYFFQAYRIAFHLSKAYGRGTMAALQVAVALWMRMSQAFPETMEDSIHCTTYESQHGLKDKEKALIYHYAGGIGKKEWEKTYG